MRCSTSYSPKDLEIWETTAKQLSGKERRLFIAKVVNRLGNGAQRFAEKELAWCRNVIRKGNRELNGEELEGDLSKRGRKKLEHHIPNLLSDIQDILEPISQTDPSFRSTQLYSPITAKEVRRRLKDDKDYSDKKLPCIRTIHTKMTDLGFKLRVVQKSKPLKKTPKTDGIFDEVHQRNRQADNQDSTLRISLDCKAVLAIGEFSRGGFSWHSQKT